MQLHRNRPLHSTMSRMERVVIYMWFGSMVSSAITSLRIVSLNAGWDQAQSHQSWTKDSRWWHVTRRTSATLIGRQSKPFAKTYKHQWVKEVRSNVSVNHLIGWVPWQSSSQALQLSALTLKWKMELTLWRETNKLVWSQGLSKLHPGITVTWHQVPLKTRRVWKLLYKQNIVMSILKAPQKPTLWASMQ